MTGDEWKTLYSRSWFDSFKYKPTESDKDAQKINDEALSTVMKKDWKHEDLKKHKDFLSGAQYFKTGGDQAWSKSPIFGWTPIIFLCIIFNVSQSWMSGKELASSSMIREII
jgi:hypothetical protein